MKWTASALQSTCAYQNVIRRTVPPSPNFIAGCKFGNEFHAAIEAHLTGGERPNMSKECGALVDRLLSSWAPMQPTLVEVAMGLSPGGAYVPVTEPEPHQYVAVDPAAELLTAGRADLIEIADDMVIVTDWKAGRMPPTEPNKTLQLLALGFAAAGRYEMPAFQLKIYAARKGEWYVGDPIALDSDLAAERWGWVEHAALLDDLPHVSKRCCMCFVRSHCKDYQAHRLESI